MPLKMFEEKNTPKNQFKKVIAVAAGKGGVGKSSVAAALALALQSQGFQVGLLDADLYGPSLRRMVPEDHIPQKKGDVFIPANANGIKIISMAHFSEGHSSGTLRAPLANKLIDHFVSGVDWSGIDVLIVDMPPGTGDIPISLCQKIPFTGVILVTTPQEIALQDVRRAAALFKEMGVPLMGILENMSYFKDAETGKKTSIFGQGGGSKLSQELKIPFLGQIPIESEFCRYMDLGFNIFKSSSESLKPIQELFLSTASYAGRFSLPAPIEKIEAENPHSFIIAWSDGVKQRFNLTDLQRECPCVECSAKPQYAEQESQTAKGLQMVGSYALKVDFSSGCKNGIYTFNFLRERGEALC